MTLGEQIRAARLNAGLNQRELAERVGVHRFSIHRWEAGLTTPGDHHATILGLALDVDLVTLVRKHRLQQHADSMAEHPELARGWGTSLRELRLARGMSQRELAHALHVSQPVVSQWELGISQPSGRNMLTIKKFMEENQ